VVIVAMLLHIIIVSQNARSSSSFCCNASYRFLLKEHKLAPPRVAAKNSYRPRERVRCSSRCVASFLLENTRLLLSLYALFGRFLLKEQSFALLLFLLRSLFL
jgi:hypothetical protein